jgi:Na+/melibiose symporter-like transporter
LRGPEADKAWGRCHEEHAFFCSWEESWPAEEGGGSWREFVEGLRFYFTHQPLLTILIAACVVMLGAGIINMLDVFFVTRNLQAPADLYGLLGMAFGAGSIIGAPLSALFHNDLVDDVLAVITSMASRIYGRRPSKRRAENIKECVEQVMKKDE